MRLFIYFLSPDPHDSFLLSLVQATGPITFYYKDIVAIVELMDHPMRDRLVDKPSQIHGHCGFAEVEERSCQQKNLFFDHKGDQIHLMSDLWLYQALS